ncbi:MAG: TIGR00341 family protein [Henriciella sp.]
MNMTANSKKAPVWRRLIQLTFRKLARATDHEAVVEHAREEGGLTGRYVFMVIMACAIAMLGLLLSSPAVIIGAMLISPLMGPIVLMGFSLSILDMQALRKAAVSILVGTVAAIAIAFFITLVSPINEATSEILARTRPNFFDLLVAVFSGLAGGYAVITRKGETIVGVAIATALMPPLAVTGYGLAVGVMPVAGGAFFLFMTNLLAIALSVTVLTRIYGFGANHSPRHTLGQTGLIIAVFVALSIPLGLALRDIAYETQVTNSVKSELLVPFEDTQSRLGDVIVGFPTNDTVRVDATILTRERVAGAEGQLQDSLAARLGRTVNVNLDQVLIDRDVALEQAAILQLAESSLAAPLRAEITRIETLAEVRRTEAELRNAVPFELAGADIDPEAHTATFFATRQASYSVAAYRAIETGLAANFTNWTIRVVPPIMDLPLIPFETGQTEITPVGAQSIETSIWALERWEVANLEIVGYASTSGALQNFNNDALAYRRAATVADILMEQGFVATPIGEFRAFSQSAEERQLGYLRFQSVLIRPAPQRPAE